MNALNDLNALKAKVQNLMPKQGAQRVHGQNQTEEILVEVIFHLITRVQELESEVKNLKKKSP